MEIRLEEEKDYLEVEKLNRNSFWNIYRPGAYEHFIVHNLRKCDSFIKDLAYIIENDGRIIGNINYSIGRIDYENSSADAVVLGPIAIDSEYQNQELGSKLINYTLKHARKMNIPFVIVIGDENYYSRFGFESASKHNIYLDGTETDEENPFFMIRIFDESKVHDEIGIFHNPDAFDVDEDELDEFDKQFEYMEKLILEGQLGV
ncbi:MAG: N-acetyltransferase [Methanobrevibacter sp.]|nr:N-acetyltransferase [Methanobrevibacter sp.]